MAQRMVTAAALLACFVACGDDDGPDGRVWECMIADGSDPDSATEIGCEADFDTLASEPLVATVSGARSDKTVIDQADGDALWFQNSQRYRIHWEFASEHLSGNGRPIVPDLGSFNTTEYYAPQRRFLLGAVTHYAGPDVWAYEIAPYDTSSAEMIEKAFRKIAASTFFGDRLVFHPTSDGVERAAEGLPDDIRVVTTDELFEGVRYQPYNLAEAYGLLRFLHVDDLETELVTFRDIVVLDAVPNDISVVSGIITEQFQTPLAHINVLSQNRGTPNMALKEAQTDPEMVALEGKWVRLEVGPFDYEIEEVTREEADAWWEDHRPPAVGVPALDLTVTDLRDAEDVLDLETLELADAIDAAIPAFGGKASHFGGLTQIPELLWPEAFVIPVFYYRQFMEENGFDDVVADILADPEARDDPLVRAARLEELRADMEATPVDPAFETLLYDKLEARWPEAPRVKFRSSTNAEDLEGFTGAGLYESWGGDPDDPTRPVLDAVRKTWSSLWAFRAFEEREYRRIDHSAVAMAILCNLSFVEEEANGVAITANLFDRAGLEPAFYVNAQAGEESVVQPPAGVTSDQFIYYYQMPNQPIVFIAHSSLVPEGESVLTRAQTYELGTALQAVHDYFYDAYGGDPEKFYAMDVEWKLDDISGEPRIWIKQARPYPGWDSQ